MASETSKFDGTADGRERQGERAPAAVRFVFWTVLGMLIAGALYLVAVRGEALIVDLSGLAGRVFCF